MTALADKLAPLGITHHSIGWHADAERYVQRGEPVPPGIRYQTVHQIASSFPEFINAMAPEE
ncbi:MAG TPA: hypothetical protein VM819_21715 [Vicinamibacterales bacterium]|nr:hypothetical protein [Vicinamibacterales bacterium]